MAKSPIQKSKQPCFIAGAGDLVIHVYRNTLEPLENQYRFNLFRCTDSGEVTNFLRPADLHDIVKACQVLAHFIADGGGLEEPLERQLFQLTEELEEITSSWSR